jgi:hypothetical protein
MTAEALLTRLDKVRQRTADQWSARCPAHEDKGPSLSVRELPDGRLLLRCFAGCEVETIMVAVGLEMVDLFPPKAPAGNGAAPVARRRLLSAAQALELLHEEATFAAVAAANIGAGIELTEEDRDRATWAAARITYLRDEVHA